MIGYATHWRATIFAAIILHVAAALVFSYVVPLFAPKPKLETVTELEWVDADLTDDVTVIDAEAIPSDAPPESLSTFDADDLILPELSIPEPKIEPVAPPLQPKPTEPPKLQPTPTKPADVKPETKPQPAQMPAKEVAPADNRQVVTRPPITINAVYPEKGSGLGFKGYVSFAAHIDKNGKVTATEILQSSGRYFVDEIARKAAEQWTFKPALDQHGRPMECDKIITFDFKKFT